MKQYKMMMDWNNIRWWWIETVKERCIGCVRRSHQCHRVPRQSGWSGGGHHPTREEDQSGIVGVHGTSQVAINHNIRQLFSFKTYFVFWFQYQKCVVPKSWFFPKIGVWYWGSNSKMIINYKIAALQSFNKKN